MKHLPILATLLFLTACTAGSDDSRPSKKFKAESLDVTASSDTAPVMSAQERFRDAFLAEVGQLRPNWNDIELLESDNRSYRFAINYREDASIGGYEEVAADTKHVARAALRTLVAQGRNPAKEWIAVHVHARQPAGTGETGQALTRVLGKSHYDSNADQVIFTFPK
ncbi:hypothetical protein [Pseudoxanthomonas wuyuanensis]|uniref:Lipoprotein n=1 Tax=Pseudoxanthomonas wuyuanensis TaxID=1073196 RepID=A0A286CXX1_9GAMM|nr:hypothetical protein [Pseudoxanthomonas wuyuanensis]KAF1722648.1 hypothetical protein CSC75_02145 [Pseudoxanthomonas wuyuanensis]SOD51240.1 hypothetical protein SAMN06296416_101523 [Pseudoxanthomonas wuyuanensis]